MSDREPARGSFHEGEVAWQTEAGSAEHLARVGRQVIRGYMSEQHREFFTLLPFVVAGSVDEHGWTSASLLAAPPGFAFSPEPRTLRIDALPSVEDPLHANLVPGAAIGLLGIQAHTRRRNRLNGRVLSQDDLGFTLGVEQSFGNCPKYIHPRVAVYAGSPPLRAVTSSTRLDERSRRLIAAADTFYLASAHPNARTSGDPSHGVDVSHRGGPPGFAHLLGDRSFIVPDYTGNDFFNTLGNLRLNPAAGLLFVDPTTGDVLTLEARAFTESRSHPLPHPAASPQEAGSPTTGRVVRFDVERVRFHEGASPLRFRAP